MPSIENAIHVSSSGYGHWLLEDLPPTLHLIEKMSDAVILVHRNCPRHVREFLKSLDREILFLDSPIIVSNLYLVGRNQDSGWMHPTDLQSLRTFPQIANSLSRSKPTRKIYASRIKSKRSPQVLGEKEPIGSMGVSPHFTAPSLFILNVDSGRL